MTTGKVAKTTGGKRVALYCRVSSLEQVQGTSLDDQKAKGTAYATAQGWAAPKVYVDEGESGAKASRPAFDEMMAAVRAGRFEVVLVTKLDRLGRSMRNMSPLLGELDDMGVSLVSINEQFDSLSTAGRLQRNILGSFAEFERDTIRDRTRGGVARRVAEGGWGGGNLAPFGYQVVPNKDGKGSRLEIDKTEAKTIKRLYRLVVEEGKSTKEAAEILNAAGMLPKRAPKWTMALIRNHLVRGADTWAGSWTYGHEGARYHREPITVAIPAILTAEQVASLRARAAATARPRRANAVHPLTGRITCECGRHMNGEARAENLNRRYVCSNHKGQKSGSKQTRCTQPSLLGIDVDLAVWRSLRPYLDDPSALIAKAEEMAEEGGADSLAEAEAAVEAARRVLAATVTKGLKLGLDEATITAMKAEAQGDYDTAVRYRDAAALTRAEAGVRATGLSEAAKAAKRLGGRLDDPTEDDMRVIFEALDVRVTITGRDPLRIVASGRMVPEEVQGALEGLGRKRSQIVPSAPSKLSLLKRTSR